MERGEAEHLLPVFNAEERVKKGELKPEDIPYMQRGGVSSAVFVRIKLTDSNESMEMCLPLFSILRAGITLISKVPKGRSGHQETRNTLWVVS